MTDRRHFAIKFLNMIKKSNSAGVCRHYAKTDSYRKTLDTIIKTGKCPFCPDNFKYHKKPILKKYQGWLCTENSWPYENTKHHFIIISKKHKETFSDLTLDDFKAIKYLVNWLVKEYNIKGGGLTMRFGEQKYTGASVLHLHLHLIVPKLKSDKKMAEHVIFPIG